MPATPRAETAHSRPARLDAHALDRAWARLSDAPEPPWLHGEVARRMGERLPIVKQVPKHVIDWWAALGDPPRLVLAEYLGEAKLLRLSGRVNRSQIQFRDLSSVYRQELGSL